VDDGRLFEGSRTKTFALDLKTRFEWKVNEHWTESGGWIYMRNEEAAGTPLVLTALSVHIYVASGWPVDVGFHVLTNIGQRFIVGAKRCR